MNPPPLAPGTVLADRFTIREVLGRGGFGIAYVAFDRDRDDLAVVKELAPEGSQRSASVITLSSGSLSPQALRQRFIDEALILSRMRIAGIPLVRTAWVENGTAYHASEYVEGAKTLEQHLDEVGPLSVDEALQLLDSLLAILEQVHAKGVLHRDIKPSNILLDPAGKPLLIDFGSAREFLLDAAHTHTVMYTPGYAPPEQLSERARRGPYSDLYSLAATTYQSLVGSPPMDVAERMAGGEYVPLSRYRPDVPSVVASSIDAALSLSAASRPQSADEMRRRLLESPQNPSLASPSAEAMRLDELLARAQRFKYPRRGCPSCGEPLDAPRPLKPNGCPVCRKGVIRLLNVHQGVCPTCRLGSLRTISASDVCPHCQSPQVTAKRSIFGKRKGELCDQCGEALPTDDRSSGEIMACPQCRSWLEVLDDGRWLMRHPVPDFRKPQSLYPEEWANVAAGLEPNSGNAECNLCGADYFLEGTRITLLGAPHDPFGFAEGYLGRLLDVEDVRWIAVGKQSPNPGLTCSSCRTEYDQDGEYFRLVWSPARRLMSAASRLFKIEDWHRIGEGLPTVEEEPAYEERIQNLLRDAYLAGELGFGDQAGVAFSGQAHREPDGARGTLVIDDREISFGGLLRKWRVPRQSLVRAEAEEGGLTLTLSGEREPFQFLLEAQSLWFDMESGSRSLQIDADAVAARINSV